MFKLPFFSKNNQNPNKFFTISINSNNVKVLLVYYDETAQTPYKVLGAATMALDEYSVRNGAITNTDDIAEKITTAIDTILDDQQENVESAIFGVSGDLALGTITTAKSTRNPTKQITEKELDTLYKKILNAAFIEAQNQYLLITGNPDTELETTTSAIVYTKLNDQLIDTSSAMGASAESIEQALFASFTPEYHLNSLREVAKKAGLQVLAVGSEMYSVLEAVKSTGTQKGDLILINMDSDFTEVTIVFGGGIVTTRSLNIGFNHLAEELSQEMGLTIHQAKKVMYSYAAQELTQSEADVVKKCIRSVLLIWLNGLEMLFAEFTGVRTFPSSAYVFGIGTTLPDVLEALSSTAWTKAIPFKDTLTLSKVNIADFMFLGDTQARVTSSDWVKGVSLCMIHKGMQQ